MKIRILTVGDYEAFNKILLEWGEDWHRKLPSYYRSAAETNYKGWPREEHEHCYVQNKRFLNLVAEENEMIVGIMCVMIHINENTHQSVIRHSWLRIYHFGVTVQNRRSEIFGILQQRVIEFAREKNIKRIITEVSYSDLDTIKTLEYMNYKQATVEYYLDFDMETPSANVSQVSCDKCRV